MLIIIRILIIPIELKACALAKEKTRRFTVPIGFQSVDSFLKALILLWGFQIAAKVHNYPKPREAKLLMAAITLYNRKLVADRAVPDLDRGSYCALRDGYEVDQFIHMMLQLWRGDFPMWHKRKTYIRDRLSINWRHQMLLRDEDIRRLDLSDCFCEPIALQHLGTSVHIRGLVICLRGGKTRSDLNSQYSVALRHKNFARCPVGAFAFYMFERFEVSIVAPEINCTGLLLRLSFMC